MMMDLSLKNYLVQRDAEGVNRAGDDSLNPRWHLFAPGGNPFLDVNCARCLAPRSDHVGILRLAYRRLRRFIKHRR